MQGPLETDPGEEYVASIHPQVPLLVKSLQVISLLPRMPGVWQTLCWPGATWDGGGNVLDGADSQGLPGGNHRLTKHACRHQLNWCRQ